MKTAPRARGANIRPEVKLIFKDGKATVDGDYAVALTLLSGERRVLEPGQSYDLPDEISLLSRQT